SYDGAVHLLYWYGWALHYDGRPALARHAFEAYLRFQPEAFDAEFGIGLGLLDEGDFDSARKRFEAAIAGAHRAWAERGDASSQKDEAKAHARLADVLEAKGDAAAAAMELEQCVRLFPY